MIAPPFASASVFVYRYTEDAVTGNVAEGFYACPTTWVIADTLAACSQTNL